MSVDLTPFIPEKFRESVLLQEFLGIITDVDTTSLVTLSVEEITAKIDGLLTIIDPWSTPNDYLQNLADLIGTILGSDSFATENQRRKELLQTIDWYKVKGTYHSIAIIGMILGTNFTIYEKYATSAWNPTLTRDPVTGEYTETPAYNALVDNYDNFVNVPWFVGDENENPSGLSAAYFKTPHFGMVFLLNVVYPAGNYNDESLFPDAVGHLGYLPAHLWRPALFTGLSSYVEKTRPVNTVPHYQLELFGECFEDKLPFRIFSSLVTTQVVGTWEYEQLFFDNGAFFDEVDSSQQTIHFFDASIDAFIATMTNWKMGTGGVDLGAAGAVHVVSPVVLSGNDVASTIYSDRIEFRFTVGINVVQNGINEIGIYNTIGELMIMCTFPNIYKGAGTELNVLIIVYRVGKEINASIREPGGTVYVTGSTTPVPPESGGGESAHESAITPPLVLDYPILRNMPI